MLTYSAVLFHDNVCLYTAAHTRTLLGHLNWELLDHPGLDLSLSPVYLSEEQIGITALQQ
jgi:hypothetical protein